MPLTVNLLDVVVIGRFNPYIISPPWLIEQGLASEKVDVKIGLDLDKGRGIISVDIEGFSWHVTDSRLTISVRDPRKNPSELAGRVLEKLPHTPVSAIGHNYHFRCELTEWHGRLPQIGDIDQTSLQSFGSPESVSWGCKLKQASQVVAIDIEQLPDAITIHTNTHRTVSRASDVIDLAEQFFSDLEQSKKLVHSITNASVV